MADYYGATADPNYGYSPYSGQLHYGSYPPSTLPFTAPPGPGNQTTIEQVAQRIYNMHPEEMAALADQWQNAWAFMADVRGFVLKQSDVLREEAWRSPAARDAFLQKGPGETLAYLDVWMEAAQQNVTALRHMVNVSTEARYAVARLMVDYERDLKESARQLGFVEHLGVWLSEGQGWDAAAEEHMAEEQAAIRDRYRLEAQRLAQHYGDQFFDYIGMVASGVGPPVQPLNAVLNQPGGLPGAGGPGGLGGPGQAGPGVPVLPVGNSPGGLLPGQNPPPGLLPPGVPLPVPEQPGVVPPGSLPPGVAPPGTLPPGLELPQPGGVQPPGALPPGVLPPGALPPGALPGQPAPVPGTLPPGALPPGALPPGTGGPTVIPPGAVRPGLPPQLGRPGRGPNVAIPPGGLPPGRTIRRPSGPATPIVPPGGREIRRNGPAVIPPPAGRPGAPQRPTRTTPGVTPPPQTSRPGRTAPGITPPPPATGRPADRRSGQPGTPPPPQTQTGRPGRPTPGVTPPPPATGRPGDRGRGRPGGPDRVPGTPGGTETFGRPPTPAAPPVLKNPADDRGARPGSAAEVRPPASAQRPGTTPPVLNRPTSPAAPPPYRPPRRQPGSAAWSDLFGAEEARGRAGAGVVDAPERARPDGGPWGLRSRAATRPESAAEVSRPGTVAPELGKRRAGGEPIPVRDDHDLVTDEQAFGVRTPGGGVVAGRGEEPPEPEIRRAFQDR
ncbi:hypothetical protein QLQ12_05550 [Actinoplanes sp. NEAU-A12]|uniref:PPE family domain-containing protein n=1 Tax=Actinoplanes sandaracinus TaxID=3045177 RepID=A0ABT6WEA5_9ACTN|nr:hypothetical protein [Actinoplanes sandaracinus]MDI6098066.1 hypothetical protein [Actinoplanes sandaracinus]